MTKITIFTDPHLGTSRKAHTTRESAARLKQALYRQAMNIVETSAYHCVNVGDLLDVARNPEDVIVQAFNVASRCLTTLPGNHDETGRLGVETTLSAIQKMGCKVTACPDLTNPYYEVLLDCLYLVPHHASQVVFEQAVANAIDHAAEHRAGKPAFLFLHCNYQFGLAVEDNTLNLTAPMTEAACEVFDFVFLGHEHKPATHMNGKVVILGNTHPTSFSDISDKFSYTLDLETAELTKELIWSAEDGYRQLTLGQEIPDLQGVQFIDVVGVEGVSEAAEVNQYIQDVWKAAHFTDRDFQPVNDLFAVRNNVKLKGALADVDTDVSVKVEDLRSRIAHDLAGSDLEALYGDLVREVEQ